MTKKMLLVVLVLTLFSISACSTPPSDSDAVAVAVERTMTALASGSDSDAVAAAVEGTMTALAPEATLAPTGANSPASTSTPTKTAISTDTPSNTSTSTPIPSDTSIPSLELPFFDDFNDGVRPEWRTVTGDWRMVDGAFGADNDSRMTYAILEGLDQRNYQISFKISGSFDGYPIAVLLRSPGNTRGLEISLDCCGCIWKLRQSDGEKILNEVDDCGLSFRSDNLVTVTAEEDIFSLYIDNELKTRIQDNTFKSGTVGIGSRRDSSTYLFDDFEVTAID